MSRPLSLPLLLLLLVLFASCAQEPSAPVDTNTGVAQAVDAALAWIKEAPTQATREAAVWTYDQQGTAGRWEDEQAREPLLPSPLIWEGDTYYLDLENFSLAGFPLGQGLAADIETLAAAGDDPNETWQRLSTELATLLAFYRLEPLGLLEAFEPIAMDPTAEGADRMSVRGEAKLAEVIGSPFLVESLNRVEEQRGEDFFPDTFQLTLVASAKDGRPLELRLENPFPHEPGEESLVYAWSRASAPIIVPQDYPSLAAFVQPARDPAALLTEAKAWLSQGGTEVSYEDGGAVLDGKGGFELLDPPGSGDWVGALPTGASAIAAGGRYYWQERRDGQAGWVSADLDELLAARDVVFVGHRDKLPPEPAGTVYRALLRSLLLETLDPHAWVERMASRAGGAGSDPIAVSRTEEGFSIRTSFVGEELFAGLSPERTGDFLVTIGNPPPGLMEGERPWNYPAKFHLLLSTDEQGRPLELLLRSNPPPVFRELAAVRMTLERSEQMIGVPVESVTLLEWLGHE